MRYWLIFNIFPGLPKKNIAAPVDYGILFAPCLCYNTSSSHNVQMAETHSVISRFFVLLLHHLPSHSPTFYFACIFVMSDQDSSKMRVSERNETCFNCRTEDVSHLQNAKTQNAKTQNYKGTFKREDSQINLRKTERKFLR